MDSIVDDTMHDFVRCLREDAVSCRIAGDENGAEWVEAVAGVIESLLFARTRGNQRIATLEAEVVNLRARVDEQKAMLAEVELTEDNARKWASRLDQAANPGRLDWLRDAASFVRQQAAQLAAFGQPVGSASEDPGAANSKWTPGHNDMPQVVTREQADLYVKGYGGTVRAVYVKEATPE